MIHHPTKYQQSNVTHFLNMHSSSVVETMNSNLLNSSKNWHNQDTDGMIHAIDDSNLIDLNSQSSPVPSNSHPIECKSFTIAAILGLNNNNNSSRNFNEVVNLSLTQTNKIFSGLERLPQLYNTGCTSASIIRSNNNAHNNYQPTGHALKNLQQTFSQHTTELASRGKFRNALEENCSKKTTLKSKRVRTIFTPDQLERLEAEFERQQYMVGPERLYLAHTLQLTEAQVKVWFQNRRIKWRKHHLEVTQQRLALIRHQQKQLVSGTRKSESDIAVMEQQACRSSLSPELTVCSESNEANNTESDND